MRKILALILTLFSSSIFAGWGGFDGWDFYNLFKQTNISQEQFYPFLREDFSIFYGSGYYSSNKLEDYPKGNISLWKELLVDWNINEIERAIYEPENFNWNNKNTENDKRAKIYVDFAQVCGKAFDYRDQRYSWDYNYIKQQKAITNTEDLLLKANTLLNNESNEQLKARYYYQIIRILHYSKHWKDAIKFYELTIKDKLPKNEIYYYITDQVAGCYFSEKKYEEAAYLFIKVFSKSFDRKKSAFDSYNLCTNKKADGKPFFKGVEDEKDFILITSLRNFSDEVVNINKFIALDENDQRVELLFMRALNNVERVVWPKISGVGNKTLPFYDKKNNYKELLSIAENQAKNYSLENKDFWEISSSYLSFINNDIKTAKIKLSKVNSFPDQKNALSMVYELFSWNEISSSNEEYIYHFLKNNPELDGEWSRLGQDCCVKMNSGNDLRNFILDKIAHTYYKNNKIAKAFLVHNYLENVNNINSIELLEALENFYFKPNKSAYEQSLIANIYTKHNFIDYINYQKGIYYLYDKNPELALVFFNKNISYRAKKTIPSTIFSNNIKESFSCDANEVMDDEVYKADIFSFINERFSRKDLAIYLVELIKLTSSKKLWKAKLANYLLANYYYNISNTGYYRGLLSDNTNEGDGIYINNANDTYFSPKITAEEIITNRSGYNLSNIAQTWNYRYEKHYFNMSELAMNYYQNVIDLSTDKELNARCTYLMAKCELNDFYNRGSDKSYKMVVNVRSNYKYEIELPDSESFKLLKEKYSGTEFHDMIIKECSYYRHYSSNY